MGIGPLALTIRRRSKPFDVFHGEDETSAAPERRVSAHDVGMPQPGDGANLP